MGDLLNNSELLRKLGIDSSNQWIIYDERFEKFFNFLSENITDANIFTEHELLESEEMKPRGSWLNESERALKLQQIESECPGLLSNTNLDVEALAAEIEVLEEATEDYTLLVNEMQNTKQSLISKLNELESAILPLHNAERELIKECQEKARQVEEVQRENCHLSEEANKCFTTQQVPPLFMHQLPLEKYFLKCDFFMQYFTLYLKEHFKIQEFEDFENPEHNTKQFNSKLDNLQNSIQYYMIECIKVKAKAKATEALINNIDLNKIHCLSLADMVRETHDLQLYNENHLKNSNETLMNALTMHVQQYTQQRMELVLYENTKQKLDRALRRREHDRQLTSIIADALSNAELVWIAIQLDLERKRNSTDRSVELYSQAQACWQRIQTMRSVNASSNGIQGQFVQEIAGLLSAHLGQNVRSTDAKSCLYEYEKFGRLLNYSLQSMLGKKSQTLAHERIAEFKRVEQTLSPFVYNSPLERPVFESVLFLRPIYYVEQQQMRLEETVRRLRTQFQETILQRMDNDKLWRYSNLLWIWFLTEPQRVLYAIEEVKKRAAKSTIVRPAGGLQRK